MIYFFKKNTVAFKKIIKSDLESKKKVRWFTLKLNVNFRTRYINIALKQNKKKYKIISVCKNLFLVIDANVV